MQEGLQEIIELSGVETCVVVDNHGSVIHKLGSTRFNNEQLEGLGVLIVRSLASLKSSGAESDELEFFFDHNQILAWDLDQAVLYAICQPSINLSLLRMTTNVVLNQWKKAPDVIKTLKKHTVGRVEGDDLFSKPDVEKTD